MATQMNSKDYPATVKEKTGKSWEEWFHFLEKGGCRKMNHREIVSYIREHHPVSAWWEQMVTVGYEKHAGLRETHERRAGYEISVTKTISCELDALFTKWENGRSRQSWLDMDLEKKSVTDGQRIRFECKADGSSLEIRFSEKGPGKSSLTVQHAKIATAKKAESLKAFWKKNLQALAGILG